MQLQGIDPMKIQHYADWINGKKGITIKDNGNNIDDDKIASVINNVTKKLLKGKANGR